MASDQRRRILIVDDEPLIVEVLKEHLKLSYDVETVLSGADALDAVSRQRPDVVLLDINMPRMNGIEVLKTLKRMDASIAVIIVTANEKIALAGETLTYGAFGYVPKPFDFRYLDHMLASLFGGARSRR